VRRALTAAGAAIVALAAGAGVAHAQAEQPTFRATVTPTAAGTRADPQPSFLSFQVTNPPANRTTASRLEIFLPRNARMSGAGLPTCSASRLESGGPSACPSRSRAGRGSATAALLTGTTTFNFDIRVFVAGRSRLLLFLQDRANRSLQAVFNATLGSGGAGFGQKITIDIPESLQQPVPGAFSALTGISARIGLRRGRRALITTNGCPDDGNHDLRARLTFVPNPTPPGQALVPIDGTANCSG
jgi:hypothetical protein